MAEADKDNFMQRLATESTFGETKRVTIDGLRLDFGFGWGLIRPSNTSAYLIIRFEAQTSDQLAQLQAIFKRELLALNADLMLPF